jgi:purine-nucleoside phosphorylase
MTLVDQISETASFIRTKTKMTPEIGIILGTGLGKLGEKITVETTISYEQIPHFAVSTVEGHAGRLIF